MSCSRLPRRLRVDGYSHPNTAPAQYRLNGGLVFLVGLLIWWLEIFAPMDWLWRVKWHAIAGRWDSAERSGVPMARVPGASRQQRNGLVQWLEGRARNVELWRRA